MFSTRVPVATQKCLRQMGHGRKLQLKSHRPRVQYARASCDSEVSAGAWASCDLVHHLPRVIASRRLSTKVRAALNAHSREKLDQMCPADVASYLWDIPETELYVDS